MGIAINRAGTMPEFKPEKLLELENLRINDPAEWAKQRNASRRTILEAVAKRFAQVKK
jgi:hypothetical protein